MTRGCFVTASAAVVAVAISGCSKEPMFKDQALDKAFLSNQLQIGSTIGDVSLVVGRGPNTFADDYKESVTESGRRVLWRPGSKEGNWSKTYTLIFENGKLVEYTR